MEQVTIKDFQKRLFFHIKNLPIEVTSRGEVIAVITSPKVTTKKVTTSPIEAKLDKIAELQEMIQKKEENSCKALMCSCGRFEAEKDGTCLRCKRGQ